MRKVNARKIYLKHYGIIPVGDDGRTYEIHHIDGNHENNDPENLIAVTFSRHYEIHESQGDWSACVLMAKQRGKSVEEISKLNSLAQQQRVTLGTHHFLGGQVQRDTQKKLLKSGEAQFSPNNNPNNIKVSCFFCKKETTLPSLKNHKRCIGEEPFQNLSGIAGKNNPSFIRLGCIVCRKETSITGFSQHYNTHLKELL